MTELRQAQEHAGAPTRHISRQGLWKLCRRAGETVGLKCWTQQLRHTHATHAWASTKDAKLIQTTLGHSAPTTGYRQARREGHPPLRLAT